MTVSHTHVGRQWPPVFPEANLPMPWPVPYKEAMTEYLTPSFKSQATGLELHAIKHHVQS